MKTFILTFLSTLFCFALMAQPNKINYQAVVRDGQGEIIKNQNVSLRLTILQGSPAGTNVYQETHDYTTNGYGLVNLKIGTGTTGDDFSAIAWDNGPLYLMVELDETGGSSFIEMGTTQLVSVPYALFAKECASVSGSDTSATDELQTLSISNDTIYLTNGGYVVLPADELQNLSGVLSQGNNAGGERITNAGDPVNDKDLTTKQYMDKKYNQMDVIINYMVDERTHAQKRFYNCVKIGGQIWMAENLYFAENIVSNAMDQLNDLSFECYCYNGIEDSCGVYGGLYQWGEMMDYNSSDAGNPGITQGLCPDGWHIPTDSEWKEMEMFLGLTSVQADGIGYRGDNNEADMIKENGITGFNAIFAGKSSIAQNYEDNGTKSYYWTATEKDGSYAWSRTVDVANGGIERNDLGKTAGLSVRCIMD